VRYAGRFVGQDEAEDVVQETLLQAQSQEAVGTGWLYAVAHRRAVDRARKRKRRARIDRTLNAVSPTPGAGEEAAKREELRQVSQALDEVSEPYRRAVRLRYLQDLSFAEVAARTKTGERTARSRVARGLAQLRQALGGRS
jgi:RNA polymerase sigma-70 factor (ECF subfamily)